MYTSQLVKLREGQHKAAVGIQIRLVLGNFSVPILMQTIKPVLSIAVDLIYAVNVCLWWGKGSAWGEEQCETPLEIERLLSCT